MNNGRNLQILGARGLGRPMGLLAVLLLLGLASPAHAQRAAARGSWGTLTRVGRETDLSSSIGNISSVLDSYTRYQAQSLSAYTASGRTGTSPGGLFVPSRRPRSGQSQPNSSLRSTVAPLFVPIHGSSTRGFVPLQSVPLSGNMAIPAMVDRVVFNLQRGQLTTLGDRQKILYNAGVGRLNAVTYAPEILIRDRANPLPNSVILATAQNHATTMQYEGLVWEGEDPLIMPEAEKVSAETLWAEKLVSTSNDFLVKGRELMASGLFQDAAVHYRNAEIAAPGLAEARAGQLCAQLAAQQFESATISLERIVQRDGAAGFSPDLKLADLWPDGDQLRGSITAAQSLVLNYPTRAQPKGLLIYLRWLNGDRTEAMRLAREVKGMPEAGTMVRLEDLLNEAVKVGNEAGTTPPVSAG